MKNLREYDRSKRFLMPPDLKDWVRKDDLVHFICEAADRVDLSAFHISRTGCGKKQYDPRMMLGLLIYCYARGIFSSRKIEAATYRDVSVMYITSTQHPDHDTIAKFRRQNAAAFKVAFEEILVLASKVGLLKVGTVSVDGTKIDANATKYKSVRYDRIQVLRKKLEQDIEELMSEAEAADSTPTDDGLNLPDKIAYCKDLKAKLDEAAAHLEEDARNAIDDYNDDIDIIDDEPSPVPKPNKQSNLTDPDSAVMRKSKHHENRQAYNAQAMVDADGTMLVLATDVVTTTNDRAGLPAMLKEMEERNALPKTLLADAGYAGANVIEYLKQHNITPLIAVGSEEPPRAYDFKPPPDKPKKPRAVHEPWRIEMIETLKSTPNKNLFNRRKQTVEPVFGIVKSILGFTRFSVRGIDKVKSEWQLVTLAYNCKRLAKLTA